MKQIFKNSSIRLLACTLVFGTSITAQENIRFTQGEVNESATLSLSVPLMSYKGRGIDLPVSLNYSSSVWSMEHLAAVRDSQNRTQTITETIFAKHSKSGWRTGLDLPVIEFPKFTDTFSWAGNPSSNPGPFNGCLGYRIAKVIIHMPDGSSHELRKSDTPHLLGYVETSGTFYAVDGSRMRYDGIDANTGTIYMPDGTRYILDAGDAQIIDRHGNELNYNPSTRTWTDTLGREIANPLPASPDADTYEYTLPGLAGVNGGEQTYYFKWERLEHALTNENDELRLMSSHYLPEPSSPPTNHGDSNYPDVHSTQDDPLFHSAYGYDLGNSKEHEVMTLVVGKYQAYAEVFNPVVLTEITLPDGSKYEFSYNVYGEIDKVVYPTNAHEEYGYQSPETETGNEEMLAKQPYVQTERRMTSRTVNADDGNGSVAWTYESTYPRVTKITAPDGTSTEVHKYIPSDYPAVKWGYTDSRKGMVIEKRAFSADSTPLIMRRELSEHGQSTNSFTFQTSCQGQTTPVVAHRNPRTTKNVSILFEGSGSVLAQTSAFTYDSTYWDTTGIDQTLADTYHFTVLSHSDGENETIGNISAGSLAKTTQTIYSASSTYRETKHILGLPTVVKIKDSAGTVVSQSEMSYDESGYVPSGSTNAMPTTMRTWDSTKGVVTNSANFLVTHATFDEDGNRTIATDAKGYTTTTTYDTEHNAFPEFVTSPIPNVNPNDIRGSTTAFVTQTVFDDVTGLVLSTTDINGETTEYEYNDDLLRPTKVTAPNGHETTTEYGAGTSESTRWVKVRSQIDENFWSEAVSKYDGLGRTYKTEKTDAQGNVFTETEYDVMGRVEKSSNPYKTGDTKKWTVPEYDDLSRTAKVTAPDTREVQITYGLSTSSAPYGTTKTITDQAGKTRKGITDALGNMVQVIESPTSSPLTTDYVFDTLGNLRKTTQGDQIRYFNYDSLGRVLRAKQVEQTVNSSLALANADPITGNNSWTVGYTYDDNSNIATTTDARDITITATYDRLNRLTDRDYEDSTSDVDFYYDGTGLGGVPNHSKGKTSRVYSTVSENKYTAFDEMGRITASQQITAGQTYAFGYTYNLSGALIEETYPSGRVVKTTLNADGELQQVQSKKNSSSGYWTYADAFSYNAAGAVTKMQLGNGHWETAEYDPNRLQVKKIGLGFTDSDQNLLKLEFNYDGPNPSSTPDMNNGSMREQKITVPAVGNNPAFTATQTYSYDNLNRLTVAEEKVSGTTTWKQTFDYDRYGNRRFDTSGSNTTTLGSCAASVCNPTISTSTNRISQSGYTYDANGSLTVDGDGNEYFYDAENHQTKVEDSGNDVLGEYFYDGDGRRVKKIGKAPNGEDELTVFVYDAAGQLVAEYSTQIETTSPKVSYLTTDHLGSPRIATDAAGGVISRKDFTAFGEEVFSAQRTSGETGNGYDPPNVRQDYTGYQKDLESGLEFAQARYYNTRHGRFTSVDPLPSSATIRNPQSFNRYSYTLNSPYKFTDPLGLIPGPATMGGCSAAYSSCYGGVPGSELEAFNFTSFKDLTVKQQQLLMTFFNTTDAKEAAKKWGDYTLTNGEQAATFLAITNALSKTTLDTGNGTKVSALDAITSIKDIKDDRIYGTMDAAITKKWQDEGKGGYTIDRADGKKETGQAKFNKGEPLVASRHENPYDPKVGKPGRFNKFEFQAVTEDLLRIQWNYTYATQIADVDIDYIPFNNPWHKSHGNSLVIKHYDDYVKKFGNPGFNVRVKPRQ